MIRRVVIRPSLKRTGEGGNPVRPDNEEPLGVADRNERISKSRLSRV